MKRSIFETILGFFVLITAVSFIAYGYNSIGKSGENNETFTARFLTIDGLTVGSDVRISGVSIGTVSEIHIDEEFFEAVVSMQLPAGLHIPKDSIASIKSSGILGGRHVSIEPGNDTAALAKGADFINTVDARSLEDLLGRAIFLVAKQAENSK